MRRVVTGVDELGKAVIVSDGPPPRSHDFAHIPGHSMHVVWRTADGSPTPDTDRTATTTNLLPGPGETVCLIVTIPPGSVMRSAEFDADAAAAERLAFAPDFQACFEPDAPGFHTTPTIDYVVMLSGQLVLELDDDSRTVIGAGEVVVQHGNRHAWRNQTSDAATFACVLVGPREVSPRE